MEFLVLNKTFETGGKMVNIHSVFVGSSFNVNNEILLDNNFDSTLTTLF